MKREQIIIVGMCIIIYIVLFWSLVIWGGKLEAQGIIQECFHNKTVTVDLPINTRYSCENMCGPPGRCSITGQQCATDVDCDGCHEPLDKNITSQNTLKIVGQNDAGKMTYNQTPQYSVLTTDIGTRAKLYKNSINLRAPQYNYGVNKWRGTYDAGMELYDQRYNPSIEHNNFLPVYKKRPTLSGQFTVEGPLASNAFM